MRLIFVCKHNRFRSKVAEAYFKKVNKNKKIKVSSGGIFKGVPVAKTVVGIGKKLGIKINKKPRCLREDKLVESDLVVVIANDVPLSLFDPRFKAIKWGVSDCSQDDEKKIESIMKQIFKKVDKLVSMLRDEE